MVINLGILLYTVIFYEMIIMNFKCWEPNKIMKRLIIGTINSYNVKVDNVRSTVTLLVLKYMTLEKSYKLYGSVVSSVVYDASNTFLIQL